MVLWFRTILLFIAGILGLLTIITSIILYTGFGVGDTWVVCPSNVAGYRWWIPLLLFGLGMLLAWLRYVVKLKINASGQCWKCGYDLQATPNRYPECGELKI